jgi:GNAT superfamily N-acetyltransferase
VSGITLRRAVPGEAAVLTDIAHAAFGALGYPAETRASLASEITVTAARIRAAETWLAADAAGAPVGFFLLRRDWLTFLFVRPDRQGCGIGRALFHHALARAALRGATEVRWLAEPRTAAFYDRMGACRRGIEPSRLLPGRLCPAFWIRPSAG